MTPAPQPRGRRVAPASPSPSPETPLTLTPRPGLPFFDGPETEVSPPGLAELQAARAAGQAERGAKAPAGAASATAPSANPAAAAVPEAAAPAAVAGPGAAPAPAEPEAARPPAALPRPQPAPPARATGVLVRRTPKPKLPAIPQPDLTPIHAPLVASPPRNALRKRDDIFKATGRMPELHHAQVQQGMNRIADAARMAQRDIAFQVGTIAAGTRWSIEGFARRMPGIVARACGSVRRVAAQVSRDARVHAEAQMREVAKHVETGAGQLGSAEGRVITQVQGLLLEGQEDLRRAKERLDAAYRANADKAGGQIKKIPDGTKPTPLSPRDQSEPGSEGGGKAPAYASFAEAEVGLSGELMADQPACRVAQYGNLLCAGALGSIVAAARDDYAKGATDRAGKLKSEENLARFFVMSMGLVAPTIEAEGQDEPGYQQKLRDRVRAQYPRLSETKRAVIAQMTVKIEGVEANLDPTNAKSIPAQSIDGLRKAGRKTEEALMDQAQVAQASLRASTAELVRAYPDLVARLRPLVADGRFLDAGPLRGRLEEASASVAALRAGQIGAVTGQSKATVAQIQRTFVKQAAQIEEMARKSVESIFGLRAPITFDFELAAAQFTGDVDAGLRAAIPAAQGFARKVAERINRPKQAKGEHVDEAEQAALRYLDSIVGGEWGSFLATVNDLKKSLGGVETDADSGRDSLFKGIRDGARQDLFERYEKVRDALPEPMSNTEIGVSVVGTVATGFVGGSYLVYRLYATDPDETEVVKALAIPWPGPPAADAWGTSQSGGPSLEALIRERMHEPECTPVLQLFRPDPATREQGRTQLLTDADRAGGIRDAAVMALARTYSAPELEHMSEADRSRLSASLRSNLNDADFEIATAYVSGEPDRALAIRLRRLFDGLRHKTQQEEMAAAEQMDQIIREELFAGEKGVVPPQQMAAMRDAALLRFAEVIYPATLPAGLPGDPRRRPRDPAARRPAPPSPTALRPRPPAARPPTATAPAPAPEPAPSEPRPAASEPDAQERMERASDIGQARELFLAYITRPREYDPRDYMQAGRTLPENAVVDRERGRLLVPLDVTVANYFRAVTLHGASSAEARGLKAAATYSRVSSSRFGLSSNEQTQLNADFSDPRFQSMKHRWDTATPEQRRDLAADWERAQTDHEAFLRQTAMHMGMPLADGPQKLPIEVVREFLSRRLGAQFAREGAEFREIGRQIVEDGRVDVRLGVKLASDGVGTNEDLFKAVLQGRTRAEIDAHRARLDEYIADETSGGLKQELQVMMLGEPASDKERAEVAALRARQQLGEGTGFIASHTMADRHETATLHHAQDAMAQRLFDAARSRQPADPDLPASADGVFQADGSISPAIMRNAFDLTPGENYGRLLGEGPPFNRLTDTVGQAAQFYQDEIDRQEGLLTSLITALAIAVSVLLLFIPGVNLIAAGILTALIAGTATIVVKTGMRGGRYGWEEMAVDIAKTGIEAATAGVGGALGKGAGLAGEGLAEASKLARVGAAINARFGRVAGSAVREGLTGAAGMAANTAIEDSTWADGLGGGLKRVAAGAAQGGLAGAVSGGMSEGITARMEAGLARGLADPKVMAGMVRTGRRLSPAGKEMLTEVLSNTAGGLSSEGINIIGDILQGRQPADAAEILKRLGQTGLRELVSSGGRTAARQHHRGAEARLRESIRQSGREPTPGQITALRRLGVSSGSLPMDARDSQVAADFRHGSARIAELPPALQPLARRMSGTDIETVLGRLNQGDFGSRHARLELVERLARAALVDAPALDAMLLDANRAMAPVRRARNEATAESRRAQGRLLSEVRSADRAALTALPMDALTALPPALQTHAARLIAAGDASPDAIRTLAAEALRTAPETDVATLAAQIGDLARTRARAAEARVATDRDTRTALKAAAPPELHGAIDTLPARDVAALARLLAAPEALDARARLDAVALIRKTAAIPPKTAHAMVAGVESARARTRADAAERRIAARLAYVDNVPEGLRRIMAQLPDDALMEIRVAQFRRERLPPERIADIVAAARGADPRVDAAALTAAIARTLGFARVRPGFREAWAQKRALLDLVPFGMKGRVLRTPVLAIPDPVFRAMVRGDGGEQAVTMILNGRPVVLISEGAPLRALAEEGIHVLQHYDPDWRTRTATLGEERLAGWEDLPLETRIRAYREKVAVEIDGQTRMLARLRRRADRALWPGARDRAAEIALAETTLAKLQRIAGRADSLTPDRILAISHGLERAPKWLEQPARLFAKNDRDVVVIAGKTAQDFERAVRRAILGGPDAGRMSLGDRAELYAFLRQLKGARPEAEVTAALTDPAVTAADPRGRVELLRQRLLADTDNGDLHRLRDDVLARLGPRLEPELQLQLHRQLHDLVDHVDAHPMERLREPLLVLLQSLQHVPTNFARAASVVDTALRIVFDTAPSGDSRFPRPLPAKIAIIEAMATIPSLLTGTRNDRATFVQAIDGIVAVASGRLGFTDMTAVVTYAIRAFYTTDTSGKLGALEKLVGAVATHNARLPAAKRADAIDMETMLRLVGEAAQETETMSKIAAVIAEAAGTRGGPAPASRPGGPTQLTPAVLAAFLKAVAPASGGIDTDLLLTLVNIGSRLRDANAPLRASDLVALVHQRELIKEAVSFSERFDKPLALAALEAHAQALVARRLAGPSGTRIALTVEQARAIAQRLDVLEHVALFQSRFGKVYKTEVTLPGGAKASRFGRHATLEALLDRFGGTLAGLPKNADAAGDIIEQEFRHFVRAEALDVMRGIVQGVVPHARLNDPASAALMIMFLTGKLDLAYVRDLAPEVRVEVQRVVVELVDSYNTAIAGGGLGRAHAKSDLETVLKLGVFDIERSAKGKLMEHAVDLLFTPKELLEMPDLKNLPQALVDRFLRLELQSRAQAKFKDLGGRARSGDHVLRFNGPDEAALALAAQRHYAVDSKNGDQAFDGHQFRRYLIEMLKSLDPKNPAGGIFGHTPDKLAGLIYLANGAANMVKAQAEVEKILTEIVRDGRITVDGKDHGLGSFNVRPEDLYERLKLTPILFAHIGLTGGVQGHPQTTVGPLSFSSRTSLQILWELMEKQRNGHL